MKRASFDVHDAVEQARERLRGLVVETPLIEAPWLSRRVGADVRFKLENAQVTGSFKARGAANRLLTLTAAERAAGVVTASSGNHGLGIARAAGRLEVAALVFVPSTTPAAKREAIASLGAQVQVYGDDCVDTEAHARRIASERGAVYVSPYNDPLVVAGQGTVAAELLRQWPEVDRVYVAVGGGGLIGGMGGYLHTAAPAVQVVGCSPQRSPAMAECVRHGRIVEVVCGDTLSDSTHGGVEPGAITLPLCQDYVHEWLDVDEQAIVGALRECLELQHQLVEGAAAVAVAACEQDPQAAGRRCAVVVCGGNLPLETLRRVLAG